MQRRDQSGNWTEPAGARAAGRRRQTNAPQRLGAHRRCYVTSAAAAAAVATLLCDVRGAESPVTSPRRYLAKPAGRPRRSTPLTARLAVRPSVRRAGLYSTRPSVASLAATSGRSAPRSFMVTDACLTTHCHKIGTAAIVEPRDLRKSASVHA